jgi:hypothetical protein
MYKDGDFYAELVCSMDGNVHLIYWDIWRYEGDMNDWAIHDSLSSKNDLNAKYPNLKFVVRDRDCIHF